MTAAAALVLDRECVDSRRAAASMAKSAGGSDGVAGELPVDELSGVVTDFVAPVDALPADTVARDDGEDSAAGDPAAMSFGAVEPVPLVRLCPSLVVGADDGNVDDDGELTGLAGRSSVGLSPELRMCRSAPVLADLADPPSVALPRPPVFFVEGDAEPPDLSAELWLPAAPPEPSS